MKELLKEGTNEEASLEDIETWRTEVQKLQDLSVVAATRDKLKAVEIPALDREIADKEAQLPEASDHLHKVRSLGRLSST